MHCSCKHVGVSIGTILLLLLACSLPIVLIYSDGLEATNIKRNNLLVAALIPLLMVIIGLSVGIWVPKIGHHQKWNTCQKFWWGAIVVVVIIVLAISVPVGVVFGKRFASIPASCATRDECNSHCTDRNEHFHLRSSINDIQYVTLTYLGGSENSEYVCGKCLCICPQYLDNDKCNSAGHAHFGFSASTKIAIGVSTGLTVMFLCIGVIMCCFDSTCCEFTGLFVGIITILLLICSMPILVIHSNDFESTTLKRNNLLVATLVPLLMTMVGFIVTCLFCKCTDTDNQRNNCRFFTTWFIVLFTSVPVGLEFGIRYASVSESCDTNDQCSQDSHMSTPTKIVIGVFGLALILILGLKIWYTKRRSNSSAGVSDDQWHTSDIFYTEQSAYRHATGRDMSNDSDDFTDDSFGWSTAYDDTIHNHDDHRYENQTAFEQYDDAFPNMGYYYVTIPEDMTAESTTDNVEQRHDTEPSGRCAICMDQQASMLMRPCKHVCMCRSCWNRYKQDNDTCPICRRQLYMDRVEQIYLN